MDNSLVWGCNADAGIDVWHRHESLVGGSGWQRVGAVCPWNCTQRMLPGRFVKMQPSPPGSSWWRLVRWSSLILWCLWGWDGLSCLSPKMLQNCSWGEVVLLEQGSLIKYWVQVGDVHSNNIHYKAVTSTLGDSSKTVSANGHPLTHWQRLFPLRPCCSSEIVGD